MWQLLGHFLLFFFLDTEMSAFSFKVKPLKFKLKKACWVISPFFHSKWNNPRTETTFVLVSYYVQGAKASSRKPPNLQTSTFFPHPLQSLGIDLFAKSICFLLIKSLDKKAGSGVTTHCFTARPSSTAPQIPAGQIQDFVPPF